VPAADPRLAPRGGGSRLIPPVRRW
jgi:hypothetical protein